MARDKFHQNVKEALEKDGWTISHDPYFLMVGRRRGFIDLGDEKEIIAAERGMEKSRSKLKVSQAVQTSFSLKMHSVSSSSISMRWKKKNPKGNYSWRRLKDSTSGFLTTRFFKNLPENTRSTS